MTEALNRDYQIGPELGRGRFGTVRQITSLSTNESFALKSISKTLITDPFDLSSVLNESKFLTHLRHVSTSIITLHAVYEDSTSLHLILDLCSGATLFDLLSLHAPLTESQAAAILAELIGAVATCHRHGVAHRDIKPENVFFDGSGGVKLGDFGSAGWIGSMGGLVGTAEYVAAEVARGEEEYGEGVDVWSCGVVMYVMLGGVFPFSGETAAEVMEAVARGNVRFPTRVFGGVSREAKDLMRKMMCRDASRRLRAEEVLSHPWFKVAVCEE